MCELCRVFPDDGSSVYIFSLSLMEINGVWEWVNLIVFQHRAVRTLTGQLKGYSTEFKGKMNTVRRFVDIKNYCAAYTVK